MIPRLLLLALWFALSGVAEANTIVAASASRSDVGTAYNIAADGDTIEIPDTLALPGGVISWTNTLTVTKAVTLQGAGIGQTIILDDITRVDGQNETEACFNLETAAGKSYRLTGIEMRIGARTTTYFSGAVQIFGDSTSIRIDNCRFDRLRNAGVRTGGAAFGCIDNNDFNGTTRHTIITRGPDLYSSSFGYGSWETPIVPGSDQMWYYEDNIFTLDDSDCFGGGRACWRFNLFMDSLIHTHGTESTGSYRACRWHEIYGNTYIKTIVDSREFVDWRDTSGLVASNTVILQGSGTASTMISLNNYRMWGPYAKWGGADGTNPLDVNDTAGGIYETGTVTTGTTSGTSVTARTITDSTKSWTVNQWRGYTLRNMSSNYATAYPYTSNYFSQISDNTATTITYKEHALANVMRFAAGNNYEIRRVLRSLDQPGSGASDPFVTGSNPLPNQSHQTIYQWSNTNGGAAVLIDPGSQTHIVNGREYTNNVAHPTWTPFTYPHPLRGVEIPPPPPSPPATPANLAAVAVGSTRIDLSWVNTAGTNAVNVHIEQSPVNNLNFAQIAFVSGSVSNYSSVNLQPGTTYYFRVRASNGAGLSAYSNQTNATTSSIIVQVPRAIRTGVFRRTVF